MSSRKCQLSYFLIRLAGLQTKNSQAAIELLLTSPTLLDNLRKAYLGNYSVILSLLGCLDHGLDAKKLVDRLIDSCGLILIILQRSQRTEPNIIVVYNRRPCSESQGGYFDISTQIFLNDYGD